MQIIKHGTVEEGLSGTWWLGDSDGNCIARLNGNWAEEYAGQELAIITFDEESEEWFGIMNEILNPTIKEEKHEVATSGLTDPLEDMRAGGER